MPDEDEPRYHLTISSDADGTLFDGELRGFVLHGFRVDDEHEWHWGICRGVTEVEVAGLAHLAVRWADLMAAPPQDMGGLPNEDRS